jgi:hypothetical protein
LKCKDTTDFLQKRKAKQVFRGRGGEVEAYISEEDGNKPTTKKKWNSYEVMMRARFAVTYFPNIVV